MRLNLPFRKEKLFSHKKVKSSSFHCTPDTIEIKGTFQEQSLEKKSEKRIHPKKLGWILFIQVKG